MAIKNIQSLFGKSSVVLQTQFIGAAFPFPPNSESLGAEWIPMEGGLHDRVTYAALWEWVQRTQGAQLVDDATWLSLQAMSIDGAVSVYSTGDGSTTFRAPTVGAEGSFFRAKGTTVTDPVILNVGFDDQIQNITGSFGIPEGGISGTWLGMVGEQGAFAPTNTGTNTISITRDTLVSNANIGVNFDASRIARTGDETHPAGQYTRWFIYTGSDAGVADVLAPTADEVMYDNATSGLVAEDVQAALDELESKHKLLDTLLAEYARPNIFDNAGFEVDQVRLYNTTTMLAGTGNYVMDRWRVYTSDALPNVWIRTNHNSGGMLRLSPTQDNSVLSIRQRVDYNDYATRLVGETVQLSANVTMDSACSISGVYRWRNHTQGVNGSGTRWNVQSISSGNTMVELAPLTVKAIDVAYNNTDEVLLEIGFEISNTTNGDLYRFFNVKMEIGEGATTYIAENPKVDLERCQRYMLRIDSCGAGHGSRSKVANTSSAGMDAAVVSFPVTMRAEPVIHSTNTFPTTYANCSHNNWVYSRNTVTYRVTTTSNGNTVYRAYGGDLVLDASN